MIGGIMKFLTLKLRSGGEETISIAAISRIRAARNGGTLVILRDRTRLIAQSDYENFLSYLDGAI